MSFCVVIMLIDGGVSGPVDENLTWHVVWGPRRPSRSLCSVSAVRRSFGVDAKRWSKGKAEGGAASGAGTCAAAAILGCMLSVFFFRLFSPRTCFVFVFFVCVSRVSGSRHSCCRRDVLSLSSCVEGGRGMRGWAAFSYFYIGCRCRPCDVACVPCSTGLVVIQLR